VISLPYGPGQAAGLGRALPAGELTRTLAADALNLMRGLDTICLDANRVARSDRQFERFILCRRYLPLLAATPRHAHSPACSCASATCVAGYSIELDSGRLIDIA
jgi:hypothetical protein